MRNDCNSIRLKTDHSRIVFLTPYGILDSLVVPPFYQDRFKLDLITPEEYMKRYSKTSEISNLNGTAFG